MSPPVEVTWPFNAAELAPQVSGSTYTWEMHDMAPIPPEPMSPAVVNLSPRIVIDYSPSGGAKDKTFASWADVSRWATAMHDPQVVVNDDVAAKARDLTANAKTEIDKILSAVGFTSFL